MCHYILKYNPSQKFRSKKNTLKYISKISKNFVLNDFHISGLWTFLGLFAFKRNLQPIRMSVGFSDCRGTFTSVFQTITKLRPYTLYRVYACRGNTVTHSLAGPRREFWKRHLLSLYNARTLRHKDIMFAIEMYKKQIQQSKCVMCMVWWWWVYGNKNKNNSTTVQNKK